MGRKHLNEASFVAKLGVVAGVRAAERHRDGIPVLIEAGEVEEQQVDPKTGRHLRCDIRLNAASGRKLASGEMKRPEVKDGRDVRGQVLVDDARRKAVARGLPYYFTCNMADVVLFSVAIRPGEQDKEEGQWQLAPISHSGDVEAHWPEIEQNWIAFLDALEMRLQAVVTARPSVTTADVIALRDAIEAIADEAIHRVCAVLSGDPGRVDEARAEAFSSFGFSVALAAATPGPFRQEVHQLLSLGAFVVAQKLVLYRVLMESGPKRIAPDDFTLDPIVDVRGLTDPVDVRDVIRRATQHAIRRSKDYETAFNLSPFEDVLFIDPPTSEDATQCEVGQAWQRLLDTINSVSWSAISANLVGFLYESVVDPEFRHQLGQHYTREDVVDLLTTFAVASPGDVLLDPASGGGSFVLSAYRRKRQMGETHDQALADTWACEITAGAAELTTISLATADTHEPAAYPRVLLRDFFAITPGMQTELQIPGESAALRIPSTFDGIVGNPPYISYRRQTNQAAVENALRTLPLAKPAFSGKSDEYVWFLVHATRFLAQGGRLAFVVSAGMLFADYGLPLIRFLGAHFRIRAVVESAVERWFIDADTNTILLLLEREEDSAARADNDIRFTRFRRPLAQLLPALNDPGRRGALEDLIDALLASDASVDDPRFQVNLVKQGHDGGLAFTSPTTTDAATLDDDEDEAQ